MKRKKALIYALMLALALASVGCGQRAMQEQPDRPEHTAAVTEPEQENDTDSERENDDAAETPSAGSIFLFCGNGGRIHLVNADDHEYKTVGYGYALEYGQALNDVMGTEYGDALVGASNEDAQFTGWTLYRADEIFWGGEPSDEEDVLSLFYNDGGSRGVEYALLRNAVLVGEDMPTEQLCGMTCHGENYLAMANWSETETE